jgi:hypothetical protein
MPPTTLYGPGRDLGVRSGEPSQAPGAPLIGEARRRNAAETGAEGTGLPPRVEALPPILQQLQDVAMAISQIEAQQPQHAEARTRRAEEALGQAVWNVQEVMAEHWSQGAGS